LLVTQSITETAGHSVVAERTEANRRPHVVRRRIVTVIGVGLGLVILLVGVVLVLGSVFAPPRYNAPWAPSYHEQFGDLREQLVALGMLR
jgi:hypothetical protein